MKTRLLIATFAGVLLASLFSATAQEARFFRIFGPVSTTITEVTADGWVTWTNELTNTTFTVQTATLVSGESHWVDWVQVPVSNAVSVHQVFDPNPPEGMAFIPAGSFLMGATTNMGHESYSGETPQHTVYVSAFYVDRTEVTKALWDEVQAWGLTNGYTDLPAGGGKATNHPVHTINWYAMVKWCNARSQKEGLMPCYYTDAGLSVVYRTGPVVLVPYVNWGVNGFRLPTEAEWEKAARGGTPGHRFPWSDSDMIQHGRGNYCAGYNYVYDLSYPAGYHPTFATGGTPYTSPVGDFAPNGYRLYDMAGNVWEWCWDWYSPSYYGNSPLSNPSGPPSGSNRVIRGCSWLTRAVGCRAAGRDYYYPSSSHDLIGFRCVRPPGQ